MLAWSAILAVVASLAVGVVVPRIAGATPYTVQTGSMSPELPPGTLVVVRPRERIPTGAVITYQLKSGQPTVVTHRVVDQAATLAGEQTFTTQGDANDVPDREQVRSVQIRGQLWYSVPYLGYVSTILSGRERQMGIYAVAIGLLLYSGLMAGGALRDRTRERTEVDA